MKVFVSLGGNEGDRFATLASAVRSFGEGKVPETKLLVVSPVYETKPIGPSSAPYLNGAMVLESQLTPDALLTELKRIEDEHGRVRYERWGSRTLDLDFLLAFDEAGTMLRLQTERLRLPHPEVFMRDFVMRPLLDLEPALRVDGKEIAQLAAMLPEDQCTILRRLDESLWPRPSI